MKLYTIIGGVNGAGKSSLTGSLRYQRADLGKVIDVDKLAAEHGGFIQGGKAAIDMQRRLIAEGMSFTQETTLSGQRPLKMAREAKAAGYTIRLYYVGINTAEEAIKRIDNRVEKGGHDIPDEDVIRRFNERNEALYKILEYVDEAVFFDNDNGFREVAQYRNGELMQYGSYCPEWLEDFIRYMAQH